MINMPKYYFESLRNAKDCMARLYKIAKQYGIVTLNDYHEICTNGLTCGVYKDNKYGWSESQFNNARVEIDYLDRWYINLPDPIPLYSEDHTTAIEPEPSLPSPDILNITIMTNEIENPDKYISDVFTHISKVKDRMINITIM